MSTQYPEPGELRTTVAAAVDALEQSLTEAFGSYEGAVRRARAESLRLLAERLSADLAHPITPAVPRPAFSDAHSGPQVPLGAAPPNGRAVVTARMVRELETLARASGRTRETAIVMRWAGRQARLAIEQVPGLTDDGYQVTPDGEGYVVLTHAQLRDKVPEALWQADGRLSDAGVEKLVRHLADVDHERLGTSAVEMCRH